MDKYRIIVKQKTYGIQTPIISYTPQVRFLMFWWEDLETDYTLLEHAEQKIQDHKLEYEFKNQKPRVSIIKYPLDKV